MLPLYQFQGNCFPHYYLRACPLPFYRCCRSRMLFVVSPSLKFPTFPFGHMTIMEEETVWSVGSFKSESVLAYISAFPETGPLVWPRQLEIRRWGSISLSTKLPSIGPGVGVLPLLETMAFPLM